MKKWVMAAALICSPLVFTSCDEMLDNAIEQDTKSTERVAFETQLSQNLKEMQQRVVFESALESTQSLTEFMGGLDAGAFKSEIDKFLASTMATKSLKSVSMTSTELSDQDKKAIKTCLKERFNMTDDEIAALTSFWKMDAYKALNKQHFTFKDGKCTITKDETAEGFCIEIVKTGEKSSKLVLNFGDTEANGVCLFAGRLLGTIPLAVQLPEKIGLSLTTAKGDVMKGTLMLSTQAASHYISINDHQWDASAVLEAVAGGRHEAIAFNASYQENGKFDVSASVGVEDKQVLAVSAKGVKEPYSQEYLDGDDLKQLENMGPIFSTCYGILRTLKGKTVEEMSITFGAELEFKAQCTDVAKSLLAMSNLYSQWGKNPTFNTVDAYTQELNKYMPFTVIQHSTGLTAQGTFVTIMKGIQHEEYQPAVALTFKGETEPQVMLNNMSEEDRANYNKMMGNLNGLIQSCDKLLGKIVEKGKEFGKLSPIK